MIAGLSWSVWLLLLAAVGVGLTVELFFFFGYRARGRTDGGRRGSER